MGKHISQWSLFLVGSTIAVTNDIRHIYITNDCIILLLNKLTINRRHIRIVYSSMCYAVHGNVKSGSRIDISLSWCLYSLTKSPPGLSCRFKIRVLHMILQKLSKWTDIFYVRVFKWKETFQIFISKLHSMINTNYTSDIQFKISALAEKTWHTKTKDCSLICTDYYLI
jgi:hypothetical protein